VVCFQQHHILFMSQVTDAGTTCANRQGTTVSFEVTHPRCIVIFAMYFKNQSCTTYAVVVLFFFFKVVEVVDVCLTSPSYFEVTYPCGVISFQMYFKEQSYTTFNTRYITAVISCIVCCIWPIFKIHWNIIYSFLGNSPASEF